MADFGKTEFDTALSLQGQANTLMAQTVGFYTRHISTPPTQAELNQHRKILHEAVLALGRVSDAPVHESAEAMEKHHKR